jgi:hypothetical protein
VRCHECDGSPIGACSFCGRFYCPDHGRAWERFGFPQGKWFCDECHARFGRQAAVQMPVAVLLACLSGAISIAFFFLLAR